MSVKFKQTQDTCALTTTNNNNNETRGDRCFIIRELPLYFYPRVTYVKLLTI